MTSKSKLLLTVVTVLVSILVMVFAVGCGDNGQHGNDWKNDETYHWKVGANGIREDREKHSFDDDNKCNVCGYEKTDSGTSSGGSSGTGGGSSTGGS